MKNKEEITEVQYEQRMSASIEKAMAAMTRRQQEAARIRDAALAILGAEGKLENFGEHGPLLQWEGDELSMLLHPSCLRPMFEAAGSTANTVVTLTGTVGMPTLGLDVWDKENGKVLNIEWNDQQEVILVSFRRGTWEEKIKNLADAVCLKNSAIN